MLERDLLVGLALTLLAWLGLVVTVLRGRANIERQRRARHDSPEGPDGR